MCLVACLRGASASLPANVGSAVYVPGDPVVAAQLPLLGGTWLDPSNSSVQPLVVATLDSSDPFVAYMLGANASLDQFLASSEPSTHYLFASWRSPAEVAVLRTRIIARLALQPAAVQSAWQGRLHFSNGTSAPQPADGDRGLGSALGPQLAAVLLQWQTPRNVITLGASSANTFSVARLDCRYTYCSWPDQDLAFTLVKGTGTPCAPGNVTVRGAFALVQLDIADAACTPEMAAAASIKQGAKGVLLAPLATNPGALLHPLGVNPGSVQQLDQPSSMVSAHTHSVEQCAR